MVGVPPAVRTLPPPAPPLSPLDFSWRTPPANSKMFSPPSQGLPASLGDVAEPDQREVGGDLSSLAKRVSAYLARVVGALADFEDRLLTEDGFFAREEHFEAQIDSLRLASISLQMR